MKPYGEKVSQGFLLATQWALENEPDLSRILDRARLSLAVKDLDMDVIAVRFPKLKGGQSSRLWGLTWDWIDARTPEEIAEYILEEAHENISLGYLPATVNGFVDEE